MPAEAILALGWTDRASLYFDLTEKAVGGLVRRGCWASITSTRRTTPARCAGRTS